MKKSCTLCGGKLKDGICTECGMDNRKSDEMYQKALNQSDCKNMRLSHVHTDKKAEPYESSVINQARRQEKTQDTGKKSVNKKAKQPEKPFADIYSQYRSKAIRTSEQWKNKEASGNGKLTIIVSIVVIVLGLVITLVDNLEKHEKMVEGIEDVSSSYEEYELQEEQEEYDPFAYVEEELPLGEEIWEEERSAGMYVVGIDIPEGEYVLEGKKGSSYSVYDSRHYLSVNDSFHSEEEDTKWVGGVKLFEGAVVCVDGMYPVKFYTENAQLENMVARTDNPLIQTFEMSGTAVAGEDFPEGTYDVYCIGDSFGVFNFDLELSREDHTVPFGISTLMEMNPKSEYPDYCSKYENFVIPAGAKLDTGEMKIKLIPSDGITTEDYISFYDNVY